jgi:DNA replication protein DnaC
MSAPLTEQAAAMTIEGACRTLRLPTIREVAGPLAEAAVRDHLTHRAYLAEVFSAELDDREARRRERRITEARFPRLKRLAEFDLGAAPSINPATLATLETGAWIDASEPVVLLGDSGTGKSHLLIGLGIAACEQGRRVRYTTTAGLVKRARRGGRRADPVAGRRALWPARSLAARRAQLRPPRPARCRAPVPGPDRA